MNNIIKITISIITAIYAFAFVYSLTSTKSIEHQARVFITSQIQKKTHQKIDSLSLNHKLLQLSGKVYKKEKENLAFFKKALKEEADEKLAKIVAKMQKRPEDSRRQSRLKAFLHNILIVTIQSLEQSTKKLENFMQYQYLHIFDKLLKDFRIFLASNLIVLLLMLYLAFRQNSTKLKFLTTLMTASTLLASYLYIFKQNWFFTIIFNDYLGITYLIYLAIILFVLVDIIFNKARITDLVLNFISTAISGLLG